ncbi:MAG: adenylate/guanylate cyclase domain-containing protein [Tagaea sp.]
MDERARTLIEWVLGPGKRGDLADFVGGVAEKLVGLGVPVHRAGALLDTLHPRFIGMQKIWEPGVETTEGRATFDNPEILSGKVRYTIDDMQETGRWFDLKLDDPRADGYDLLPALRGRGYTHYVMAPLAFVQGPIQGLLLATRRAGGFSRADLDLIDAARPALAAVLELKANARVGREILQAYVGTAPGDSILAGRIRRGDVTRVRAALLMSDLRGFTSMSLSLDPEAVVARLNGYFDRVVPAVVSRGGEVLKFIGDGVLAIANTAARGDEAAGRSLLEAARAAQEGLREAGLRAGIALHLGEVAYGNIGAGDRLDFTAIGRDVNLLARLEKMCGTLGEPIVASAEFAAAVLGPWRRLGDYAFKGFEGAREVFAPG